MKRYQLRAIGLALVLATVSSQALAGPGWGGRGHGGGYGGGYHGGGYHGGGGYRGPNGWWIGGALALAAAGTVIAINSQPRYSYAPPVYAQPVYAAPVYAQPVYGAPVYAAPPVQYAPAPVYAPQVEYAPVQRVASSGTDVVAYPSRGQSSDQQGRDRYECHQWAVNQSGFDPSYVTQYTTSANTESYRRAVGACMTGRGYGVN